ncbi:MAG: hypothetical protein KF865_02350 [Bdellovibrionaceae bacterium]|nr:hypothetical protein [Pseudobdellovibrionaceae bacterium]
MHGIFSRLGRRSYQLLELELASSRSGRRTAVFFKIEKHDLAQRWARMLWNSLRNEQLKVYKNYLFHGWLSEGRTLKFLCEELDRHISLINGFFAEHHEEPYAITQRVSLETMDQDLLNQIHRHFENLIGHSWNVSRFYTKAPSEIRWSIENLNWLVHEIENLRCCQERMSRGFCQSHMFVSFEGAERQDLRFEDYAHFDPHIDFGDVCLHYAQIGKPHLDAFHSQDEIIDMSSVNGLRYLTAEFDISFRDADRREVDSWMPRFRAWMREKGLDPDDRRLAIGFARIASFDRSHFPAQSNLEIMRFLHGFDDLVGVRLHSSRRRMEKRFEETAASV